MPGSGCTIFSKTLMIISFCFALSTSQSEGITDLDADENDRNDTTTWSEGITDLDVDENDRNDTTTWNSTQSSVYEDCSENDLSGPIIPCSTDEDPFAETRSVIEGLRYGGEKGFPVSGAYENRRVADPKGVDPVKAVTQTKAAASLVTSYTAVLNAHKVGESAMEVIKKMDAEKLKSILQKGLKFLGAIASVAQFVGPIFDIVLMFLPKAKSPELKAIETGFSETDAALDVLSLRLDQLEDISDFNAILSDLINFEASVDHGMTKYRAVADYFNENDLDEDLTLEGKTLLEDLVNYIKETGDIAKQMQFLTKHILQGTTLAFDGERLLTTFRRAQQNDCSKILPFGYRLLNIISTPAR